MNRSSLLVPDQVTKTQEVNGTNEKAAAAAAVAAVAAVVAVPSPVTEPVAKASDHSTDSEQDEGGDTDEPGNSKSHNTCCCGSADKHHWLNRATFLKMTLCRSAGPAHRDRAVLHCQFCGKRGHAHNFMRSKRFCSTSCARG